MLTFEKLRKDAKCGKTLLVDENGRERLLLYIGNIGIFTRKIGNNYEAIWTEKEIKNWKIKQKQTIERFFECVNSVSSIGFYNNNEKHYDFSINKESGFCHKGVLKRKTGNYIAIDIDAGKIVASGFDENERSW